MASRAKFDNRRGVRPCIRRHRSWTLPHLPMPERYVLATFVRMIRIGDALLSEDVFDEHFACDWRRAKALAVWKETAVRR